ncbi:MAG: SBBP repeat-containing protein [Lewinellaceae bacterium]|nr:SBBP repeat-containing protein [Lewinellaceae bacterium]
MIEVKRPKNTDNIAPGIWSTYYGGSGFLDIINNFAVDASQNSLACGVTRSIDFPTLNPIQGFNSLSGAGLDAFALKFNSGGESIWATFYGGGFNFSGVLGTSGSEFATSIAADAADNVYFVGNTFSGNFPLEQASGAHFDDNPPVDLAGNRGFIVKLDNSGNRVWASFFGEKEAGYENVSVVEVAENGHVFIAGYIDPVDVYSTFPAQATGNAHSETEGSNFITEFSPSGQVVWATLFSSSADNNQIFDMAIDGDELYVTGNVSGDGPGVFELSNLGNVSIQSTFGGGTSDAFVAKFTDERELYWSTYLGGDGYDAGISIEADGLGQVYVAGNTQSSDGSFPLQAPASGPGIFDNTLNGSQDLFIAKFSSEGAMEWNTFFGGDGEEAQMDEGDPVTFLRIGGESIDVDDCGNIYVTGRTTSEDLNVQNISGFPFHYPDINRGDNNTASDAFILTVDGNLEQKYLSYWGGARFETPLGFRMLGEDYIIFGGESSSASSAGATIPLGTLSVNSYLQDDVSNSADAFISQLTLPESISCIVNTREEVGSQQGLLVYPNPTAGTIFINTSIPGHQLRYSLYDGFGRRLSAGGIPQTVEGLPAIGLSSYPTGVYYLYLEGPGLSQGFKILKY